MPLQLNRASPPIVLPPAPLSHAPHSHSPPTPSSPTLHRPHPPPSHAANRAHPSAASHAHVFKPRPHLEATPPPPLFPPPELLSGSFRWHRSVPPVSMVVGPPSTNAHAFGILEVAALCLDRSAPRVHQSLWCVVLRALTRMRLVQPCCYPTAPPMGLWDPAEIWGRCGAGGGGYRAGRADIGGSYGADVGLGGQLSD